MSKQAKEKFYEFGGDEEKDPVERLRFFCSLAMNGQDWLDVEPFFDAIKQHDAEPVAREQIVECITGAIHRHMSTPVYPREVAEAARYIVDNYLSAPSIPEGWQPVPKCPTEAMINAGATFQGAVVYGMPEVHNIYQDMLSASPQPTKGDA